MASEDSRFGARERPPKPGGRAPFSVGRSTVSMSRSFTLKLGEGGQSGKLSHMADLVTLASYESILDA